MLWQSELLQSNGVKVFEEGRKKGISRYKDFFESIEKRETDKKDEIKPVKIEPVKEFMEG
jgi:hypothetical protein